MLLLVIPLSLLAALLYSTSDFLEQRAASLDSRAGHPAPTADARPRIVRALGGVAATMRRLVTDRRWAAGWLIGTIALFIQALALHLGSVAVVQTLQVTSLLFAIPLSSVYSRFKPTLRDYSGGLLVCAGLVVVIAVRGGDAGNGSTRPSPWLFVAVACVVVGLIAMAATSPAGPVRVTALATAAGVAFGSSAALVKLTTADLSGVGIPGTARDWPGYCLALATGVGLVVQQLAFASGRLAAATTAMIVANPLVGYAVAVLGFGEHLPASPGRLSGIALGGACAVIGIVMLAHSPVLFGSDDEVESGPRQPEVAGNLCGGPT